MNILYISNITDAKWTGPHKSVPNQINAQSKYDNVLWYNVNETPKDTWKVDVNFVNLIDFPSMKIDHLPAPFNHPDLVVFQQFYYVEYCIIARTLEKRNIPYLIIPRSSLTDSAQHSKFLKKKLGNFLFFSRFARKAVAIQYLTEEEFRQSGVRWNKCAVIIPNGEHKKTKTKSEFRESKLKGVYIGRLDIYQKGLDLLVQACAKLKNELVANDVQIELYGPDCNGSKSVLMKWIKDFDLQNIITMKDPVFDEEKEKVLLDSDFFILTSRFEGHPMGLIEALSYGLPCLVTTGSNMAEVIKKSNSGWASEVSIEGIIDSFQLLINEKMSFPSKGKNALELSLDYNWDNLAKYTSERYMELIK